MGYDALIEENTGKCSCWTFETAGKSRDCKADWGKKKLNRGGGRKMG